MSIELVHEPYVDAQQQANAYRAGMWIFLASELMLFGVLFLSYTICRWNYPDAFSVVGQETDKLLGTANTLVLLTSSLFMAMAVSRPRPVFLLLVTAALGSLFIFLKGYEWMSDIHKGYLPGSGFHWTKSGAAPRQAELFFYLYFVLTGIHMIHLSIGVLVASALAYLTWRGRQIGQAVEMGGLYWHFVDIVWVFLYPLFYLIPHR